MGKYLVSESSKIKIEIVDKEILNIKLIIILNNNNN